MKTLIITPEMTELFNTCTGQKNYKEFYDTYKSDIESCSRDLENVQFPEVFSQKKAVITFFQNKLCHFITRNMSQLFAILTSYPPCDRRRLVFRGCQAEVKQPELIDGLRTAINLMDWAPFYKKYWKHADTIIHEARRQNFLNVMFQLNDKYYINLESRDSDISPQANNSERRPMDRPSTSLQDRSPMLLCEPENRGNNETEILEARSSLESFGEIALIASETPEDSVVELPGRIDEGQSTSLGGFLGPSGPSGSRDLSPRAIPSYEVQSDRLDLNLNLQVEYTEVNTSEVKIAELKDELGSILAGLRRNNEVPTRGEGLPSSTSVLNITNTSRTATGNDDLQQKLEDEYNRHEREMWRLAKRI
ncbi:unnamed protein product [Caenorhabditis brenneri]